jgi:hypothetical protein
MSHNHLKGRSLADPEVRALLSDGYQLNQADDFDFRNEDDYLDGMVYLEIRTDQHFVADLNWGVGTFRRKEEAIEAFIKAHPERCIVTSLDVADLSDLNEAFP